MIDYVMRRAKRAWQKAFPKAEPKPTGAVRIREIEPADWSGVIELLTKGFWRIPRDHWLTVMDLLTAHSTPDGFPRFGLLLENNGRPVGVLLTVFTERFIDGVRQIWCCGSSFYVEPNFRFYADPLLKRAQRFKDVTYLDLTSSPKRWEAMTRQGFQRIARGVYVGIPALCRAISGAQVQMIRDLCSDRRLDQHEIELLVDHSRFPNVTAVTCEHEGRLYPFVFGLRRRYGIPFAFLLYTRSHADFVKFAGPLGRFFIKRGIPLIICDADSPIESIPGRFMALFPKFWRGGRPPLGDLAYTEIAMFGVI